MLPFIILAAALLLPLFYYLLKSPSIPGVPNATPGLPLIGNAISYGVDPIEFLISQRAKHGDVVYVNLAVLRAVFFLGPEGNNAVLRGTEKSGISLYAALADLLGKLVRKGGRFINRANLGLAFNGWVEASHKILVSTLSVPKNLDCWIESIRPIMKENFSIWAETSEDVSLFRDLSDLVMTSLFTIFLGPEFAKMHAEELVPMVRAYEWALQRPQTKVLPRWMSEEGRLLDSVEERFVGLVNDEINKRLKEKERYQHNRDYLQLLLNMVGDKYLPAYAYHILSLLNGGHTNSVTTFCWSFLHASRTSLLSTLRKTKNRHLLEAIFRETGRLYTNLVMLRRVTTSQVIMGKYIAAGTLIAISPLVTARDPDLFPEPDRFRPERWMNGDELNEAAVKDSVRSGTSLQFGKGQHMCLGEKIGRILVLDILWEGVLGKGKEPGVDIEIVSGIRDGIGVDNVGVEPAWAEENLGTPFEKGDPVIVRFKKRTT